MKISIANHTFDTNSFFAKAKLLIPSLLITYINLRYVVPFLFRHGSSAAFELMIAALLLNAILITIAIVYAKTGKNLVNIAANKLRNV